MLQDYLACGSDQADAADFYSLNVYEWCGDSSFDGSGYSELVANSSGLQIPIFISETGCRLPKPRLFDDQDAIFGSDMNGTWSGAIIYEWIEETNDYGLISYGPTVNPQSNTAAPDGFIRSGTTSPVSPDFTNLKNHWATLNPTGVALSAYSAQASSLSPIACPATTPNGWMVNPTLALPSLGETLDLAATSTGGIGGPTTHCVRKERGRGRNETRKHDDGRQRGSYDGHITHLRHARIFILAVSHIKHTYSSSLLLLRGHI